MTIKTIATTPNGGALDLGVDVGLLLDVPIAESLVDADTYNPASGHGDSNERPRTHPNHDTEASGEHPFSFAEGAQGDLHNRKLALRSDGHGDSDLDLDADAMARLAHLQAQGWHQAAAAWVKITLGNLLLGSDGQRANDKYFPNDAKQLYVLAAQIVHRAAKFSKDDAKAFAALHAQFLEGGRANIQTFVQRVLRESYLIQNELLLAQANKTSRLNTTKSNIRKRAKLVREKKTRWASDEQGTTGLFTEDPIEYLNMGDGGTWVPRITTQEDVDAFIANFDAARSAQGIFVKPTGYDAFYADASSLNPGERHFLESIIKDKGNKTDDYIRKHIGELLRLVPQLTQSEFDRYIADPEHGVLKNLSAGNMDEKEFMDIMFSLSPVQALYLYSGGYDPRNDVANSLGNIDPTDGDIGETSGGAMAGATAGASYGGTLGPFAAITTVFGAALGAVIGALKSDGLDAVQQADIALLFVQSGQAIASHLAMEYTGSIDPPSAAALLKALHVNGGARIAPGGAPRIGESLSLHTTADLDDYLKTLEDQLSSVGEDSQLANVDLQNTLQKQQQTIQMLSSIAKLLHETAIATIRKVGA